MLCHEMSPHYRALSDARRVVERVSGMRDGTKNTRWWSGDPRQRGTCHASHGATLPKPPPDAACIHVYRPRFPFLVDVYRDQEIQRFAAPARTPSNLERGAAPNRDRNGHSVSGSRSRRPSMTPRPSPAPKTPILSRPVPNSLPAPAAANHDAALGPPYVISPVDDAAAAVPNLEPDLLSLKCLRLFRWRRPDMADR
ncbi:hypothetical protein BDW02DRAFT_269769 [Decorospora gaudefroyi]|uniref:Uncharacterized protein n=1 Tax=Decorospora gaudefroyi TaxID=184978 RepID=A0A6A5KQ65_9PLEO|nr:hypothetical protein BDW02DRAFT_269769 [Decorospora gaudefroyi]